MIHIGKNKLTDKIDLTTIVKISRQVGSDLSVWVCLPTRTNQEDKPSQLNYLLAMKWHHASFFILLPPDTRRFYPTLPTMYVAH